MAKRELHVGIVGAGMGGVMCSIAVARAGANVTVLEAASQLGEIGAGIQMTPNVSRLLIRYGVDKVIGENLVQFREVNLRQKDGKIRGHTPTDRVEKTLGYPWWLVHRHHLHTGLVAVARRSGVNLITDSRVTGLEERPGGTVTVTTEKGRSHSFDLVVGSDGVRSIVRKQLFPDVRPRPPSGNCAYRAIVPYDEIRKDPLTRSLVENEQGDLIKTMEVWMASTGYIIAYPISNARDFNMVLSHFREPPVETMQEVSIDEVRNDFKSYDPRIQRIIEKIKPGISRWPLLVTGPLNSWSNSKKNVVLIGDAAHSMTNHMAQGAATSMEDGAYLAKCLEAVIDRRLSSVSEAIKVYEKGRMPKASYKQQVSYLNGWLWQLPDGPATEARNKTMEAELKGKVPMRSANLYGDPTTVLECYGYDAVSHADEEIAAWINHGPVQDALTTVTGTEANKIANWMLPKGYKFKIQPRL